HRHLTKRGARKVIPALREDALVGAIQYFDAMVDDARYTMQLARTAAAYGAHVASRVRVVDLLRDAGRVTGARLTDLETGTSFDVRARQVVNATACGQTKPNRWPANAGNSTCKHPRVSTWLFRAIGSAAIQA